MIGIFAGADAHAEAGAEGGLRYAVRLLYMYSCPDTGLTSTSPHVDVGGMLP